MQVQEAVRVKGVGGSRSGHLKVGRLEISHLGHGAGSRGQRASQDSSLLTSVRLSQSHTFLARNYFQEYELRELIGPCSERAFTVANQLRSKVLISLPLGSEKNKQPPAVPPASKQHTSETGSTFLAET